MVYKKKCVTCGKKKYKEHFRRVNNKTLSYTASCDSCSAKRLKKREATKAIGKLLSLDTLSKKCSQCLKVKNGSDFPLIQDRFGGARLNSPCLKCAANNARAKRKALPVRRLLQSAKRRAVSMGFSFNLRERDIQFPKHCPVLGIRLDNSAPAFTNNKPTLDRINPRKGYIRGNVRVISWRANRLKSDGSLYELKRIVSYMENANIKANQVGDHINRIKSALSPNLLGPKYQHMHDPDNPTAGHCYIAAEALWHFLGGASSDWVPMRAREEDGMTHWWLRNRKTGKIADPTEDQYRLVGEEPPYHLGKAGGFLTKRPSKRASQILRKM